MNTRSEVHTAMLMEHTASYDLMTCSLMKKLTSISADKHDVTPQNMISIKHSSVTKLKYVYKTGGGGGGGERGDHYGWGIRLLGQSLCIDLLNPTGYVMHHNA
jgi:hypothetical protein